jgi:hypothetical protein
MDKPIVKNPWDLRMYLEEVQSAISIYFKHCDSSKEEAATTYERFINEEASIAQVLILGKLPEVIQNPNVQKELQKNSVNLRDLYAAMLMVYTTEHWETTYTCLLIYESIGIDCKASSGCKTLSNLNLQQLLKETNDTFKLLMH